MLTISAHRSHVQLLAKRLVGLALDAGPIREGYLFVFDGSGEDRPGQKSTISDELYGFRWIARGVPRPIAYHWAVFTRHDNARDRQLDRSLELLRYTEHQGSVGALTAVGEGRTAGCGWQAAASTSVAYQRLNPNGRTKLRSRRRRGERGRDRASRCCEVVDKADWGRKPQPIC